MRYRCIRCGQNRATSHGTYCPACVYDILGPEDCVEDALEWLASAPVALRNPWADMPLLRLPMPVFVNPDPPVRPAYSNGGWM